MAVPNNKLKALGHQVFAALETAPGVLKFPAATDYVIPAGFAELSQAPTLTDSEEVADTLSLIEQFTDRLGTGTWSVPMYLRLGAKGTVPQGDALFTSLFGQKTIVANTSVTYALTKGSKPSFSIWERCGAVVFFAKGATASSYKTALATKGGLKLDFSGEFMLMGWVGVDHLAVAPQLNDLEVEVDNAKLFTVGGRVQFRLAGGAGTIYNNSAAGYEITAVDTATNTLTLADGLETDLAIDDFVEPYLPVGTKVGTPMAARDGKVSFDNGASTAKVTSFALDVSTPVEYDLEEMSDDPHPTSYSEKQRAVKASVGLNFRNADLAYFADGMAGEEVEAVITVGADVAGERVKFVMPRLALPVPKKTYNTPAVKLALDAVAKGTTAGEDEIAMVLD